MIPFIKTLASVCLLVHASAALSGELAGAESTDGFVRFDEDKWITDDTVRTDREYERFFLMSINRPTKMSFKPGKNRDSEIVGTIERLGTDGGKGMSCSLPVFADRRASYFVKLRSLRNDIEIFSVIKAYPEKKNNGMDIFLINMRDCKWSKTETLKGFDFESRKIFISLKECKDNKNMEIFSDYGEKDCGARVCRWTFNFENQSISNPAKFNILEGKPDWWLQFIAPSDKEGYFAIIQKDKQINLLSLSNNGMIQYLWEEDLDSWGQALRVSTMNGAFSYCLRDYKMKNTIKCTQLDKELKLKNKKSLSFDSEPKMMGLQNLPEWGLMLLTVQCPEEDQWRCKNAQISLDKIFFERTEKLTEFKEDSCWLKKRSKIGFFRDEAEKKCIFYECDTKIEQGWDKSIKTRCF